MSDEIVMSKGESGTPVDIYDEPINRFVADFIGEKAHRWWGHEGRSPCRIRWKRIECADAGMRPNEEVEIVDSSRRFSVNDNWKKGKLTVEVDTQLFRGVH